MTASCHVDICDNVGVTSTNMVKESEFSNQNVKKCKNEFLNS